MRYPVDNNVLDITTKNSTTNTNLSIKDDNIGNKEKLKIVEDDVNSVEDCCHINDILRREKSEERINISLMFLTIPLSLVLLGFLLKILLVLQTNNLDLLIFTRSEGDYNNAASIS